MLGCRMGGGNEVAGIEGAVDDGWPRPADEPVMKRICSIHLVQHSSLMSATQLCYGGAMKGPGFQRARSAAAKYLRETAILEVGSAGWELVGDTPSHPDRDRRSR